MSIHNRGIKPKPAKSTDALTKAPPVPDYFSPYAKEEWKRIMPRLIKDRIITKADLAGLENYCVMIGTVKEIETNRTLNSRDIDPKLFGVQNRAAQTARQLAAEYGLSPTSRARIGSNATDDDDDNPLAVR
ncbi:P27 family phage terminase small subunit [Nioella ostreopsis]|uniref:P27 family phage terminase small subunit n=1 Tax=Nioella ostreopsis TaxID=2448479 RepID=UPI000FDA5F0C|nr:P27 family phage terminase small subunit [Nioella ostreopsis]